MIRVQKFKDLGRFQNAWLNAHYHFSFSGYYNPERMGHGPLRVINDDIVKAGGGFQMHPHRDMEIITYVRQGAISHRDNLGNKGSTEAGNVQVMSAGTGIYHSEHNLESVDTNLYQIWIEPREEGVKPRWETKSFPKKASSGLSLLASGLKEHADSGAAFIHADAAIYGGVLKKGANLKQALGDKAYLLVSSGSIVLDGQTLTKGDGAQISDLKKLELKANEESELVLIDLH